MPREIAVLALLLACSACASSKSDESEASSAVADAAAGVPVRVAVLEYQHSVRIELVNNSHTDKLEQYSEIRPDASRKVQDDDVMAALLEYLDQEGFSRLAVPGLAPAMGSRLTTWALEIETPTSKRHILGSALTIAEDKREALKMKTAVVQLFNATRGWQAVQIQDGKLPFQSTTPPVKRP